MELEELKKSWNALNDHLKDKKLVTDDEIKKLISHTGGSIHAMNRFSIRLLIISLLILAVCLTETFLMGDFGLFHIAILVALIPGLCWDVFTTRFLQKTHIERMPLVEVIERINRFHRWIIGERVAAIAFLLLLAILFFIEQAVWQHGTAYILVYIVSWGIGLGLALWVYHRKILGRIRDIKKNLNELKELM